MDADLRRSMLRYYDERASEYEDAYVIGTGTASIPDPDVFRREAVLLASIVERCAHGRIVDLACGTGYWLPYYASRGSSLTLIDQSPRMLDQCRKKVAALGAADRASVIEADVFDHRLDERAYDSALIAIGGRFLILESAYSVERARFNARIERQERRLNDGTRFDIYKRYIDRDDLARWTASYGVVLSIEHFGTAFVAVSGCFET